MRPDSKWHRLTGPAFPLSGLGAIALTAACCVPLAAASTDSGGASVRDAAAAGVVYGGTTSQGGPVAIQVNKSRRQVVRAATALHLACTTGNFANLPDSYIRLP